MQQMVIANRLRDGAVVFLGRDETWVTWIGDGAVLEDDAAAESALALAKRHAAESVIVEPALIEVGVDGQGLPRPTAIREAIRAFGPSVETDPSAGHAAERPPETAQA